MSSITRCPACNTLFKVVEDQLRVSQGWVRCGQCHSVFDATVHLQAGDESTMLGQEPRVAGAHMGEIGVAQAEQAEPSVDLEAAHALKEPVAGTAQVQRVASGSAQPPSASALQDLPADVGFLRERKRASAGRTVMLVLCSGVLALALAAQVAWWLRSALAAHHPAVAPWLAQTCDALGCEVPALKRIEAWSVEGVSVQPAGSANAVGLYKLQLTLRSAADVPLASPSIELSLQDSNEQVTHRKVLSPEQLGLVGQVSAAGAEHSVQAHFSVSEPPGAAPKRLAGYRVTAFYPQ